jgi:protein SCO1/2
VVLAAIGIGLAAAFARGGGEARMTGVALDRPVPILPLRDESGRRTTLAGFRGRVVVLAPTLTFCHEVCPITSGALEQIQYDVARVGLSRRVAIVEVSVDPWRDSPRRLRRYRQLTGVTFHLLTGSKRELTRFWKVFGVGFFPTGQGRSFDVAHTDGAFFVDARGRLRIAIVGMPNVHGRLAERLKRLLSGRGLTNLRHPEAAWDVRQALDDLERLVGRPIPDQPLP